jgi:hypothetical protein
MSNKTIQIRDKIESLIHEIDGLDKNTIKEKLKDVLSLFVDSQKMCPKCDQMCDFIKKQGKEIFEDARYDSAETMYDVCPSCGYYEADY